MEHECLALKDLTTPRKSFPSEPEEGGAANDQKENVCAARRRTTPLKPADATVLAGRKSGTPDLSHTTPIKLACLPEPWTPTSNLKMLISAASPDIRNREMKKVLFRPIENETDVMDAAEDDYEMEDFGPSETLDEEDEKKPSRKQKSLGLLCRKFLDLYPDYPSVNDPIWIILDEVATKLGVERRRIYDIVNVLESLTIVGRIAKNSYMWYGRLRLEATLEELQQRGVQQGYHLQMGQDKGAAACREEDVGDPDNIHAVGNRKDKSLRIMSQKFVMLFLVSKTQTVTLDAAAKILIDDGQDSSSHSKYKTKVRRLYDIANVLTSLNLIKKVHVREERGRKPAFRWLGPTEFDKSKSSGNTANGVTVPPPEAAQLVTLRDLRRTKIARHGSFNVTPTSVVVQRQVNSAPCSPYRDTTVLSVHTSGLLNQPVDYSKKTMGTQRHHNGNMTPTRVAAAALSPSSAHPSLLAPTLHPEQLYTTSSPSPHCVAYLPSLSQPMVVMLNHAPDTTTHGHASSQPEESRKRQREEEEDGNEMAAKRRGESAEVTRVETNTHSGAAQDESEPNNTESAQTYLYVPNNAGLENLNFLLAAGQSPAGLALPSSTLAVPYFLVPSTALSHYPLVAAGLQQQNPDGQMSISIPAMVSPSHFMVGAAPEISSSPAMLPSSPEQRRVFVSAAATPQSPSAQTLSVSTDPLTPHTPKEIPVSGSKAFFQTPGTQGSRISAAPATRKRASAQRRLDISHPQAS
ncbi:transcription factor E2F7 isoform 1-T1 [Synchiropus picturatus]